MARFSYNVYHPLTGAFVAQLNVKEPSWAESVNGSGNFSAKIVVPNDLDTIDAIRAGTQLGMNLFVQDGTQIPWSGYISARKWSSDSNEITITALEWRTYLYRILVAPSTDLTLPNVYTYEAVDQLTIARDLVAKGIADGIGIGIPQFYSGTGLSGIERDLIARGTSFRSIATWIDSMANRDSGFEWDVTTTIGSNAIPKLNFNTYYPQQGASIPGLEFRYGTNTGNILSYEDPQESNDSLVLRQWAVGSGPDSDSLPFAVDEDPDLPDNQLLRFDKATSWQDVIDVVTLASHARAEREFYSVPLTLFAFTVRLSDPDISTYMKGDRCRLVVKDRWLDIDVDDVRIIERVVSPDTSAVKVTVDLSDLTLPEADTDGAV